MVAAGCRNLIVKAGDDDTDASFSVGLLTSARVQDTVDEFKQLLWILFWIVFGTALAQFVVCPPVGCQNSKDVTESTAILSASAPAVDA